MACTRLGNCCYPAFLGGEGRGKVTTAALRGQSSGAMYKSRWPSWAPVPNKPRVSLDVKQLNQIFAEPALSECCQPFFGLSYSFLQREHILG